MQTTNFQTVIEHLTPISTATSTDGVGTTMNPNGSNTFLARVSSPEGWQSAEDDSTDIFLLERCSPLNDF